MLVQDVMTRMPHTIGSAQSVAIAKRMMQEFGIRHLPVQEQGKLIGIISERDIYFADRLQPEDPDSLTAADICTLDPEVFSGAESVKKIALTMAQKAIGCALIVENEKLVGVFTTTDACRLLAENL